MAIFGSKKDYRDGDTVACQQCGKQTQIKWFADKQSALVPPGEREKLALRCQSCGFITCNACAHPDDSMFPTCPNCKKEWGPYYFIGSGGGKGQADGGNSESEEETSKHPVQTGNWEDALRMDLPQMDELSAAKSFSAPKSSRMSGSPLALLLFLLIGVLVAAVVFALLRIPGITAAVKNLLPAATSTPFVLSSAPEDGGMPDLVDKQIVTIVGYIEPPQDQDACEMDEKDIVWCQVFILLEDSTSLELWVRQGKQVNALTDNLEFLDNDGTSIKPGSGVEIEGIALCEEDSPCQIRVQKIEATSLATRKPTPAREASKTPVQTRRATQAATTTTQATTQSSGTQAPTDTLTPTLATVGDCRDALGMTLDDLGKEDVCVQGIVREYFKDETAQLLFFDQESTSFTFVSYGPSLNFAPGTCVYGRGKIAQLGARPAIVVTYKSLVEECP